MSIIPKGNVLESQLERVLEQEGLLNAFEDERIQVVVLPSFPELGKLVALRFIEWVQHNPEGVASLPTGKTPEYFIRWMNQDLGPKPSRDLASQVKYLVIAGDLVEGIGIFPDQLDELTISTQKAQYEEAARLLDKLPDHIETIIIPGNHDAVRRSLPQPAIPESHAPGLYANPRIHMAPNPISLTLNGVKIFVAHGSALSDILGSTPGHDFRNPVTAVEL